MQEGDGGGREILRGKMGINSCWRSNEVTGLCTRFASFFGV